MTFTIKIKHTVIPATLLSLLLATQAGAYDLAGYSVHGSASVTASASDHLNYLGKTRKGFDLNVAEVILNGSKRYDNGLEVTAQFYGYRLAGYDEATVDFASLGYSFSSEIGIRAGRVKIPFGLYGDTQDVDFVRPFAFLPLSLYPKTLRPLTSSVDGANVYGHIDAKKAGSFDYQAFLGTHGKIDTLSPYIRSATDDLFYRTDSMTPKTDWGAQVIYNAPVEGLRFAYSLSHYDGIEFQTTLKSAAETYKASGDYRALPLLFPTGAWDFLIANKHFLLKTDVVFEMYSAEYTKGDFVFSAEYRRQTIKATGTPPAPLPAINSKSTGDGYYGMVTWQALKKLQVGAYYAQSVNDTEDRDGSNLKYVPSNRAWLHDACGAVSYSITDWWLVKGEVHLLNGTQGVSAYENTDRPVSNWGNSWNYYVLKTTVSF